MPKKDIYKYIHIYISIHSHILTREHPRTSSGSWSCRADAIVAMGLLFWAPTI